MKKSKLLFPLVGVATATSTLIPLTMLTGCSKTTAGNLLTEYTPTIGKMAEQSLANPEKVVDVYLEAVETSPEIFEQDLRYTLSRGLPEYISYTSKFCELKEYDYNMDIDRNSIKVDKDKKTITFDATFKILFDYTGTKYDEMIYYETYIYRWDTETKAQFVFDFNTSAFDDLNILGKRKQMGTLAGATQLGLSEFGSTVKILSEKGTKVDLDGIEHAIDITNGETHRFILPNETWWTAKEKAADYKKIYQDVAALWVGHPGIQSIILMLKYYMGSQMYDDSSLPIPNALDFGSYYLSQITLDDVYTFASIGETNDLELYGFNLCLDSINNKNNLAKTTYSEENKELTLPGTFDGKDVVSISSNAFNSAQSNYSNLGIPNCVENVVIPKQITEIESNAFASNAFIKKVTFQHDASSNIYPSISNNAFYALANLNYIDFSQFRDSDIAALIPMAQFQFGNVHFGRLSDEKFEGTIKLPDDVLDGSTAEQWKTFVTNLGFHIFGEGEQAYGWKLED